MKKALLSSLGVLLCILIGAFMAQPVPSAEYFLGDLDYDGDVDGADLETFSSVFGTAGIPVSFAEITEVELLDPLNEMGFPEIIIHGSGFGVDEPIVSLGRYGYLKINSWSDVLIRAMLPEDLVPGEYKLTVSPQGNADVEYHLTVSEPGVPMNMVAFFAATQCPSGWSVVESLRGRAVVGLQVHGTLYGSVGTPLTDKQEPTHTHSYDYSVQGTTSSAGAHEHDGSTTLNGGHGHNTLGPSAKTWVTPGDGGAGYYVASYDHTHETENAANAGKHLHGVEAFSNGGHSHTFSYSSRMESTGATSNVMPYLQLLPCRKN